MKAMILAAGRGTRMLPLTADRPKPLLDVGGRPLLEHHILNLREAGFSQLVVNAAYLSEQIEAFCGDGSRWGLEITVSVEPEPLETAGGIIQALPLLGDNPFVVVNGDIWCPYPFQTLCSIPVPPGGAHLVLTENPEHNPQGDFSLTPAGAVDFLREQRSLTYTGIGVFHPDFFAGLTQGSRPLRPLLDRAIEAGLVTGQHWTDEWIDIGTPERLAHLDRRLLARRGISS
jgi:MurNAc alpha-1-phosphate uridylyltransferase